MAVIFLLILTATISQWFVQRSGESWVSGGICSRWYDGGGGCRADTALTLTTLLALLLPFVSGMLVGVTTFSRDFEQGPENLDLRESTNLVRWYFSRILVVFVPVTLAMTLLGLVLGWTHSLGRGATTTDEMSSFSLMEFPNFHTTGIVVGAYTFVAMVTGSAAALLVRNTVVAMVTTLLVFLIVPVALSAMVREHYAFPDIEVQPIDGRARAAEYAPSPYQNLDSRWVIGAGFADTDGNMIDADYSMCRGSDNSDQTQQDREIDDCLREQGIDHYALTYHSQSRYWLFQFIETAVMLLCAGVMMMLALFGARGLRRQSAECTMSEMLKVAEQ
ncbi:hypothetical protein QM716_21895 [Rhodococcus sp. IEGM 1409]|uniref:hypothetical protein n=1 Tax=Rhodococcus sp. IEGM 1409 TaxID=3047082 RepID=UPI0024B7A95A|nr:hypothetical protein [Rhodococcus sp. IEGM 1409]MDI9902514.1 hypothetical protein [Rhodococcus sp. IEGM 1409]